MNGCRGLRTTSTHQCLWNKGRQRASGSLCRHKCWPYWRNFLHTGGVCGASGPPPHHVAETEAGRNGHVCWTLMLSLQVIELQGLNWSNRFISLCFLVFSDDHFCSVRSSWPKTCWKIQKSCFTLYICHLSNKKQLIINVHLPCLFVYMQKQPKGLKEASRRRWRAVSHKPAHNIIKWQNRVLKACVFKSCVIREIARTDKHRVSTMN